MRPRNYTISADVPDGETIICPNCNGTGDDPDTMICVMCGGFGTLGDDDEIEDIDATEYIVHWDSPRLTRPTKEEQEP